MDTAVGGLGKRSAFSIDRVYCDIHLIRFFLGSQHLVTFNIKAAKAERVSLRQISDLRPEQVADCDIMPTM